MFHRAVSFLRNVTRRDQDEREIAAEVSAHLALLIEEKVRLGMKPEEAERAARIELGGVEQVKEGIRDARTGAWLEGARRDLGYGARTLRKNPGFTIVTIATLALVIGGNTAIFSAFYGLVFRHLPYKDAGQLVLLFESNRQKGIEHSDVIDGTVPFFRHAKSLEGLATFLPPRLPSISAYSLSLWGTSAHINLVPCSSQLFQILNVKPILGRDFQSGDHPTNGSGAVILSARFWKQHYGARSDVIGQTLSVNVSGIKQDHTIVGVMPEEVEFPYPLNGQKPDGWEVAGSPTPKGQVVRGILLPVIGRLKPGVGLRHAQAEINTIAEQIRAAYPKEYDGESVEMVSLQSELVRDVRPILWILAVSLGFLLLIGCANVSNLLLVRGFVRAKEMAVRSALGAGRLVLVRQMVMEAALLVAGGGILGFLLAYWGLHAFLALLPPSLYVPRMQEVALDPRTLALTALCSALAAVVFAVAPSLRMSRSSEVLKSVTIGNGHGGSVLRRPGSLLLILEVSLVLVLLTGTVLLTKSLHRLLEVNVQFHPEHLVTMEVRLSNPAVLSLNGAGNGGLAKVGRLYPDFQRRASALPGMHAVTLSWSFPLLDFPMTFKAASGGGTIAKSAQPAEMQVVTPNFFEMMGYRLARGRWLADGDMNGSVPVAIINEAMAERYWPDGDPIGVSLLAPVRHMDPDTAFTIVGVVKEPARFGSGKRAEPSAYFSLAQVPETGVVALAVATDDSRSVIGGLREAALNILPGQMLVGTPRTGTEWVSESSARLRFTTMLVSVFSGLALLLALIGIYGVISYYTAQRTREIGIRMAFGATPGRVLSLVLGEGTMLVSIGTVIGLAAGYAFTKSLASLLYDVRPTDTTAFLGPAVLFFAVASIAFYAPARRAARVDPMVALRYE
jgi:predicted permease